MSLSELLWRRKIALFKAKTNYILFTNVFNEAPKIQQLFEHVAKLNLLPRRWIIINDGSNDNTWQELEKYVGEFSNLKTMIQVFNLPPKEKGDLTTIGQAYAYVFEHANLKAENYDFMSILDVDTELHPNYYNEAARIFQHVDIVGIVSGYISGQERSIYQPEGCGKCVRWEVVKEINFWDPAPDTQINITNLALGYGWSVIKGDVGLLRAPQASRNTTAKGAFHAGWFWYYVGGSRSSAYIRMFYRMLRRRFGRDFIRGYNHNRNVEKRMTNDTRVLAFYKKHPRSSKNVWKKIDV